MLESVETIERKKEEKKKGQKFMFKEIVGSIKEKLEKLENSAKALENSAKAFDNANYKKPAIDVLNSMQKDNTIISVTTGRNSGYYELYNWNGEAVARTFNGDTTEIYKDGNVWSFKEQEDDGEVSISKENGLPTLAFLRKILRDDDTQVTTKVGIKDTFITHKLPTQNKLLSEFIKDNIKGFTGLRIKLIDASIRRITIEIESEGNKLIPYCTILGYQILKDWRLDMMWNWNGQLDIKDTENLIALRDRELAKLQMNIQGYIRVKEDNKLKSSQNIYGAEYTKATDEGKQEYIDKALNEVVNSYNVPFIGDRISLREDVDSYYHKNGNAQNLTEVVYYICYTKGLFAPYEYALVNNFRIY